MTAIGIKCEETLSTERANFVSIADVIPDAILDIRYYTTFNFVGERISSYEAPVAYLCKDAALALKKVSDELKAIGFRIKIYDAYRPQSAVDHFIRWAEDTNATEMKAHFYPDVDKADLFELGYIAKKSEHSRGAAVDLTIVDIVTGAEVDMGCGFDFFSEVAHSYHTAGLTAEQIDNRAILRRAMMANGFLPNPDEWWHYRLEKEPYPDRYFDFPITENMRLSAAVV